MLCSAMLYTGSAVIIAWGIAHIAIPTRSVLDSFEPMPPDNRRILLMEWLMEGVLLIFVGVLVALVRAFAPADDVVATIVYRASAAVLVVMAAISVMTGARTRIGPMKLCPFIFTGTAILFWLSTVI